MSGNEIIMEIALKQDQVRPPDQADKLRRLVRKARKKALVLAVTSGKGGVGKSNVAANLAICLSAAGKSVILIDADLGLANLDIILPVKSRGNLSQVISGSKKLVDIIQPGPGGIKLICGASGIAQMADINEFQRQRLVQELSELEYKSDIIIIDTGAGISQNVLSFCRAADHTLMVTTMEPTSITDAYTMIKALIQGPTPPRMSLLVNMVDNRPQAKMVYERIMTACQRFLQCGISDAGYLLRDEHLCQAVRQREPVVLAYPRAPVTYCFVALTQKLAQSRTLSGQTGFFRKVVNWFF